MNLNHKKAAACLLLVCALCLTGCAISPPDSLKRTGVESRSLISASTADLAPDERAVALYFRYQDSSYLATEARAVVVQRNESLEKAIVEALITGPLNTELSPLFPVGTEVVNTSTQDGTLFVTLNEAFLGRYADESSDAVSAEGTMRRQLCLQSIAAALTPMGFRSKKKSGAPMSAPQPKQMSCRFVRLNSTLLFTFVRSLGTFT